MKKTVKLISLILVAILSLSMLSACGGSDGNDVTGKYLCTSAAINGNEIGADGEWLNLEKGGKGSYYAGLEFSIEWKLDGENLSVEVKLFSESYTGTLKNNVIELDMGGTIFTFVKEGASAPAPGGKETSSQSGQESSSQSGQESSSQSEQGNNSQGTTFDTGEICVFVPEGWYAIPEHDLFSSDEVLTNVISVCKGGSEESDLWSKPYIRIDHSDPGLTRSLDKDFYDTAEDVKLQCGSYSWEGFTTSDYGLAAFLLAENDGHQYVASITLESSGGSISLDDADVQAILASVALSSGNTSTVQTGSADDVDYDLWDGDWYGWWCLKRGTGLYQEASDRNLCFDVCANLEINGNNTGRIVIWDSCTTQEQPLVYGYELTFAPGESKYGVMNSSRVVFFPAETWASGIDAVEMDERTIGWTVDPANSTVSQFDDMLEITGHYESPENPDDAFDYYVFLRPWGTEWDDVQVGDTTGCVYKDMMPVHYTDWYLPLLDLGYEQPVDYAEGKQIISEAASGGIVGSLDPADKEGADGRVDMATLKAGLTWVNENQSFSLTYDEIASHFGTHGKKTSESEKNVWYRWSATDDIHVTITFDLHDDGSETWNVTQYKGL